MGSCARDDLILHQNHSSSAGGNLRWTWFRTSESRAGDEAPKLQNLQENRFL